MSRSEVDNFLAALKHPLRDALAELCEVIRSTDPRITETIKWHAPSFAITDHFATTGLEKKTTAIRLVLHTGAKKKANQPPVTIDDPQGLLTWRAPDRAVLFFSAPDAVSAAAPELRRILPQWIAQTQ